MSSNSISRNNLYEQYLSQCYLAKQYTLGACAERAKLDQFIEAQYTDRKAEKYAESNAFFNSALQEIATHNYLIACINIFKALCHSSSYANKIRRIICAAWHK